MRIYVACLASYNAGRLVGEWLDVSTDPDENSAAISGVLSRSPINGAEEWAIHDYEAPRILGDLLGENPGYQTLADAQAMIEALESHYSDSEDLDAVLEVMVDGMGWPLDFGSIDVDEWLSDHVAGESDTLKDWAAEFLDETGMFEGLPDNSPLRTYFDFESYARDLRLGGDVTTARASGRVLVFWNR